MYAVAIARENGEGEFRDAARRCVTLGLRPGDVAFVDAEAPALLPMPPCDVVPAPLRVPRRYSEMLRDVACHRATDRFALAYELLFRIAAGEDRLLDAHADPSVARFHGLAQAVRRDVHRMHAFVRFRPHEIDERSVFVAWFEPQHHVVRRATPFFVDRFTDMEWMIATPVGTALWRDHVLSFLPGGTSPTRVADVVLDETWATYYRSTFDPSRLRTETMRARMPLRYWRNMPETRTIPELVTDAGRRVDEMTNRGPDEPPRYAAALASPRAHAPPPADVLSRARGEIDGCRRCALHAAATQAVFGDGPPDAPIVLVGEQPGDREDVEGRPFVGPAGRLLDRALAEAGIDRTRVYLTNVVKHFKYEARGKRRLHAKPDASEIVACRWWLDLELSALSPRLLVALGATAASALAARAVSVTRERGPLAFGGAAGYVTVHPSFLLRLPDEKRRVAEYRAFVDDLRRVAAMAEAV